MTRRQQVVDAAALALFTVACSAGWLLGRLGYGPWARR